MRVAIVGSLPPCIYCGTNAAESREHWLPAWMGAFRGVDTLRGKLCGACNRELGRSVDTPMARMGPEAHDRYRLRIAGRDTDWEKANPFYFRAQAPEPPTTASTTFPGRDHKVLVEDEEGVTAMGEPRRVAMRQIVLRDATGAAHAVPLPHGCTGEWLRTALGNKGLVGTRLEEIICDREEDRLVPEWLRSALDSCFPDAQRIQVSARTDGGGGVFASETRFGISLEYLRGIAKLAFHALLALRPDIDGRDVAFAQLRDFIRLGSGTPAQFVSMDARQFILARGSGHLTRDGHYLMLDVGSQSIQMHVRMFVLSPYGRNPMVVSMGRTPANLSRYRVTGYFLKLFPEGERDGFVGEILTRRTCFFRGRWGVWA